MRRCRTCGFEDEIFKIDNTYTCNECGADPTELASFKKVHAGIVVDGYLSPDQLKSAIMKDREEKMAAKPVRESKSDSSQARPNLVVLEKPKMSAFVFSMRMVTFTGILATCMMIAFFIMLIVKAFT